MSEGMEEIIEDFVTEAEESLEKIDPLFVELESEGYDREILNDIFRSMHTIKGAAGFLGFQPIVDVAHNTEALLKRLREGEMEITPPLITLVLKSTDMIKLLLSHIKTKDGVEEDISAIISELEMALQSDEAEAPSVEPQPARPEAPEEPQVEAPEPVSEAGPFEMGGEMEETVLPSSDREEPADVMEELFGGVSEDEEEDFHSEEEYEIEAGGDDDLVPEEIEPDASSVAPEIQAAIEAAQRTLAGSPGVVEEKAAEAPKYAEGPAKGTAEQQRGAPARGGLQTLRVDVDRIDKVMNLTGEIVLVRNRLLNISSALDEKISGDEHVEGLQEAVSFLDLVTSDVQLAVMKMRMQPIKKVFGKFPRLVRDISQNLGKDVQLNISGEETEVDRSVIERIGDPLVHSIRNAIDHGIEGVEQRRLLGKPPKGLVEVKAYQQGSQIVIEVVDDGRGLDIEKIKQKGMAQGLISEEDAPKMTDKEVINLIFLPGFSTVEVATELSGRGVGMDVVKTSISRLNGYVEILTAKGEGTTLRISIPLTLAIIQALMVRTEGAQYAIPLGPIEETLKVAVNEIDYVSGNPVLSLRDRVYPLAELKDMLNLRPTDEEPAGHKHRYVLVISVGDRHFAVAVDELIGQEEVVIKAIDGIDTDDTGILGATITGEGNIVLILDPSGMARLIKELAAA
jgi:two-component system chemotaxis sensor kinase CheA